MNSYQCLVKDLNIKANTKDVPVTNTVINTKEVPATNTKEVPKDESEIDKIIKYAKLHYKLLLYIILLYMFLHSEFLISYLSKYFDFLVDGSNYSFIGKLIVSIIIAIVVIFLS